MIYKLTVVWTIRFLHPKSCSFSFSYTFLSSSHFAPTLALCPVLSPDETKIAYVIHHGYYDSNTGLYFRIMLMNVDGSEEHIVATLLYNDYYSSTCLSWSPDGTRLAYNCSSSGNPETILIYSIKTDGTGEIQITSRSDYDGAPSWIE